MSTDQQAGEQQPGIIARLWQGDIAMGTIFWGFIVIPNLFFKLVEHILNLQAEAHTPDLSTILFATTFALLQFVYWGFILLALWRSSNKCAESNVWSVVAKIYVGISGVFYLWSSWTLISFFGSLS